MKVLFGKDIGTFTFNPATKQISFFGNLNLALKDFYLITNTTTNTIIYNFAKDGLGGTLSSNVLTLEYNTVGMGANDELQILLEIGEPTIDFGRSAQKVIPLRPAPIITDDAETLVATATQIASSVNVRTVQGSPIDVRNCDTIHFLFTHTRVNGTTVQLGLQVADSLTGTYYAPVESEFIKAIGDATGSKSVFFNVKPFQYVRLVGRVQTGTSDTISIKFNKTLNA